ncbi:MAG TPA: ATP synthase F1 subunit gamma [Anaerolineae bacterium]|nr:ATP synthase F1 subunit gamma [Anaerolineae bacterium]
MASAREMRLRIRSVNNISQVTRALQAVSASRVRKAEQLVRATRPYASKAWQVLRHLAIQPGRDYIHPLLMHRETVKKVLVVLVSGDRGLAGAYNTNVIRYALESCKASPAPISFAVVGRKGRDMLFRRGMNILAEFSDLPAEPTFADVSAIGRLAVEEFLEGRADQVFLIYTDFINFLRQDPSRKLLLPFELDAEQIAIGREDWARESANEHDASAGSYIYEPSAEALIDRIVPRLTELQVFQAILESQASEHAARMVAMRNATDNAIELVGALRLEYNKARQQAITSEMLDIVGGAEAIGEA